MPNEKSTIYNTFPYQQFGSAIRISRRFKPGQGVKQVFGFVFHQGRGNQKTLVIESFRFTGEIEVYMGHMPKPEKTNSFLVFEEEYQNMLDAEGHNSATSMGWLEKKLYLLEAKVLAGRSIMVEKAKKTLILESPDDFYAWCRREFPGGYYCYLRERNQTDFTK